MCAKDGSDAFAVAKLRRGVNLPVGERLEEISVVTALRGNRSERHRDSRPPSWQSDENPLSNTFTCQEQGQE